MFSKDFEQIKTSQYFNKKFDLGDDETKKFNNVSEKIFRYHTIAEKIASKIYGTAKYNVLILASPKNFPFFFLPNSEAM